MTTSAASGGSGGEVFDQAASGASRAQLSRGQSPMVSAEGGDGGVVGTLEHKHSFRSSGHPTVPTNLQLKQVVIICRHGDRAPVSRNLGTVLKDGPDATSLWTSKLPHKTDLDAWNEAFPPRVLGDNCGRTIEEITQAEGPWGQLTSRGAEELGLVGKGLRSVLDGGGGGKQLFPDGLEAEKSSIFVRCTHLKRTHQSSQNLLMGLGLSGGVDLHVRPSERETLYPNSKNTGLRQAEIIAQANAENNWPGQEELARKTAEMFGIAEDTLKWTVAREVVTCYEAHGVPLPPGAISSGLVQNVVDFTGWMWGRWFNNREMTRISLGPFVAEVLSVMGIVGECAGVPEAGIACTPKLAIFSGHDSTLVPVLCALKLYHDDWPTYASYLSLDVAEDKSGATLVRVVYNGKEQTLPDATGPWIPLEDLRQRLADIMPRSEDMQPPAATEQAGEAGSAELSAAVGGKGNDA